MTRGAGSYHVRAARLDGWHRNQLRHGLSASVARRSPGDPDEIADKIADEMAPGGASAPGAHLGCKFRKLAAIWRESHRIGVRCKMLPLSPANSVAMRTAPSILAPHGPHDGRPSPRAPHAHTMSYMTADWILESI